MARKPAPVPAETGTFHRQLEKPEVVGEITVAEASEIKALNDVITRQEADAIHAQRVLQVCVMHKRQFLLDLIKARGLDTADLYNVKDDSGQILRTHELVTPSSMEVIAGGVAAEGVEP